METTFHPSKLSAPLSWRDVAALQDWIVAEHRAAQANAFDYRYGQMAMIACDMIDGVTMTGHDEIPDIQECRTVWDKEASEFWAAFIAIYGEE